MEAMDGHLWRLWRDPLRLDSRAAIAEILESLVSADLVRLYEMDGKRLIHIPRYRQRLRYFGRICPPSPWTTEEQKQKLEKTSPGASQARTGRAPGAHRSEVEVDVDVDVDVDVEKKRREEVVVTPTSTARAEAPTIKTVLNKLAVKGEKPTARSRDEQLAYVAKNGKA
jgi:hypothetical protein